MLDLIALNGQACATGTCPQALVATSYVLAPQVVAAAPALPGKTVVQYRRNLFGKLVPTYATVTATVAATEAKGSSCKGNCK